MTLNTQTANLGSELDQEINNPTGGNSSGKSFFSLTDDNPVATIRFLSYPTSGNAVLVHYHFDNDKSKGVQMPCLVQYGKDCPYCSRGEQTLAAQGITMRKMFLFPIWWVEQSCQALFAYSVLGWSPLPAIHQAVTMRKKNGVQPNRYNFVLSRQKPQGRAKTKASMTTVVYEDVATDPNDDPLYEVVKTTAPWTVEELRDKYLSTMQTFDAKRHEGAVTASTSLDADLGTMGDISL